MIQVPLLIVGDNPAGIGGLARQGRDLASLASTLPEFRVGYLGRGMGNSRKLPWVTYPFPEGDWGQGVLREVWADFAGASRGVVLTTDDLSRRLWLATGIGAGPIAQWLAERPFKLWGYVPLDSVGPDGHGLGIEARTALGGFDRVLASSEWGMRVFARHRADADWLPHGLAAAWRVVPKAKELMGWSDSVVVGVVMANQSRKDWPVAISALRTLRENYGHSFKAWIHVDRLNHYWNIPALAEDYGTRGWLEVTQNLQDDELALRYSGCDATMLPSAGEGFGYPIAESLACGTASVVTDYAAGQELVSREDKVRPVAFRVDTSHNVTRAVLDGEGFARATRDAVERKLADPPGESERLAATVEHLAWGKLKWLWENWLRGGLR